MMVSRDENDMMFGRLDDSGNVQILYGTDGTAVTRIDANVYPISSGLSVRYNHPEGIVLSQGDAASLGIDIEDEQ